MKWLAALALALHLTTCATLPKLPEGSYLENRVSCSQEDGCSGKAIVHIPLR
jgi:hypothetical protein